MLNVSFYLCRNKTIVMVFANNRSCMKIFTCTASPYEQKIVRVPGESLVNNAENIF